MITTIVTVIRTTVTRRLWKQLSIIVIIIIIIIIFIFISFI